MQQSRVRRTAKGISLPIFTWAGRAIMCVCRMTPFPGLRSRHALRQRNYWLSTTMPSGARTRPGLGSGAEPHPVLYSERRTVNARNLAADPRVVVHLVSAEDVVIVRATAEDLGTPARVPEVLAALSAKYTGEQDRQYLPDADQSRKVSCL